MDNSDTRRLRDAFGRITALWQGQFPSRPEIAELGLDLDFSEMRVLFRLLEDNHPVRPTDLAILVGTSPSNVSKLLRKLNDRGLIERIPSRVDRRVTWVAPTDEGRRITHLLLERIDQRLAMNVSRWDAQDVNELIRLLDKLFDSAMETE